MDDEARRGIEAFRNWVDETKPGRAASPTSAALTGCTRRSTPIRPSR